MVCERRTMVAVVSVCLPRSFSLSKKGCIVRTIPGIQLSAFHPVFGRVRLVHVGRNLWAPLSTTAHMMLQLLSVLCDLFFPSGLHASWLLLSHFLPWMLFSCRFAIHSLTAHNSTRPRHLFWCSLSF